MSINQTTISCSVNIEWVNKQAVIIRKITHKNATIVISRNQFRDIFLSITSQKSIPVKFKLKNFNVHKKFINQGKASIKLSDDNCTVFLSNAPPADLQAFLRTIFIKITNDNDPNTKTPSRLSLRTQLLTGNVNKLEEISPVTLMALKKAKIKAGITTDLSPSPTAKRKRSPSKENSLEKRSKGKRLSYDSSRIVKEPGKKIHHGYSLNEEQLNVLNACLAGHNIFFTGSAGTGKSYLLKKIIASLPPEQTFATASTGVAACHIGGVTLHTFAGIGTGEATLERCIQLASRQNVSQNWRKCKTLIIDEISMLDGKYFERLEQVSRSLRRNDKPFGGIQLILCGDFLQLPPVQKHSNKRFCFQTQAWSKSVQYTYELIKVHRQTDLKFVNILNSIRIGETTKEICEHLQATSQQNIEQDGILATRLCSHTNDAQLINEAKLKELQDSQIMTFQAEDSDASYTDILDKQTPISSKIVLKIGAQVMLLKNINLSQGLVNGARGVVVNFTKNNLPVVKFRNNFEYIAKKEKWTIKVTGNYQVTRSQVPLCLAWAFSIHKSQGLTLDCVEMSLKKVFEAGQAYVALSRAKSLDTLRVLDFDSKQVWANPDVLQFYRRLNIRSKQMQIVALGKSNRA